jgi:hypothetical protein
MHRHDKPRQIQPVDSTSSDGRQEIHVRECTGVAAGHNGTELYMANVIGQNA